MSKELRKNILGLAALGVVTNPEQFQNMLRLADGQPILNVSIPEQCEALGAKTIRNTLDTMGNVLVAGEKYKFRGENVLVLSEEFGAGNILDTYYRIHYMDSNFEKQVSCVQGKGGMFRAANYQSQFEPTEEKQ